MQLIITIQNQSEQPLTQKIYLYIENQESPISVKKLQPKMSEEVIFTIHPEDINKNIMLSYLNVESAIIITAIGRITQETQPKVLAITDITPQGSIKYDFK